MCKKRRNKGGIPLKKIAYFTCSNNEKALSMWTVRNVHIDSMGKIASQDRLNQQGERE